MSRPRPLPTAPDHELHDPLLVAQIASGDDLDPEERRTGEWFVSSCGACAALAAELRMVSGAVAWEPTPPRRRDFRIDAEQAQRLQGNRLRRFVRRLALPQAGSLRPAAAGVMSIGLVFVAAGALWPGDTLERPSVDETVPMRVEASAPAVPGSSDVGAGAAESQAMPAGTFESFSDAAAMELGAAQKSTASQRDIEDPEGADADVADMAAESSEMTQQAGRSVVQPEALDVASDAAELATEGDDLMVTTPATPGQDDDGIGIDTLLLTLGAVLAAGGGVLLVLMWWSRRSADPLLR